MEYKSKILVIGGTGHFGKFIVEASTKAGHPTFALIRSETLSNSSKASIIDNFKDLGVHLLSGDVHDHESLVEAIKQVDVVIAALTTLKAGDQMMIIEAIKQAGNVKRFFPAEFGVDVDRTRAVDPFRSLVFEPKVRIRRAVEAEGIPYTYVSANCFNGHFLVSMSQLEGDSILMSPPREKVVILGDGNVKAVYNNEKDIATYTIRAVDDPKTLNKILYIRPANNIFSFNELISLWEEKIGQTLEKMYITEEEILKNIQECSYPTNALLSVRHAIHVAGDTDLKIDPLLGVEASTLYPDVEYTSVDKYLDQFV